MNSTPHPNIKYRRDIDGLRALAVLSVVFFHISPNLLPGGFLGVDIFFVISGYLITLILVKELETTGRISFSNFYKRRINRIIPASVVVLLSTLVTGFLIMVPADLLDLVDSTLWSYFSAANVYFYLAIDTSYFATGSEELPLLHFWSLGVEEQFYFLWPAFILLLGSLAKSTDIKLTVVGCLIVASIVFAQYFFKVDESLTYYMIPGRAWELLAGGIAAQLVFYRKLNFSNLGNEILALTGLVLVISSLFIITESHSVPGIASLPVIMGSVFLIISNFEYRTFVGTVFSLKILVGIGLVSYSAYLWHWPILAFLHYALIDIDLYVGLCVLIATFFLAVVSYYFIETPFRKTTLSISRVIFSRFVLPSFVIVGVCAAITWSIQTQHPYFSWPLLEAAETDTQPAYAYKYNCQHSNFKPNAFRDSRCVYPENADLENALLIGDSNAAHYVGMLRVIAKDFKFSFRNATQSSCPMVFGDEFDWISKRYAAGCGVYRSLVLEEAKKYDSVFIGGNWSNFYNKKNFNKAFEQTISDYSENVNHVILLGKVPIFRKYTRHCEIRSIRMSHLNCSNYFVSKNNKSSANSFLREIAAKHKNVEYFDVQQLICVDQECSPYLDGRPVYFDVGHLSMKGSELIGEKLVGDEAVSLKVFEHLRNTEQSSSTTTSLTVGERFIEFSVSPENEHVQVAFYLYKGRKRIDIQPYSKNLTYQMDTEKFNDGRYRVRYFIVSDKETNPGRSNKKEVGYSDYVKVEKKTN